VLSLWAGRTSSLLFLKVCLLAALCCSLIARCFFNWSWACSFAMLKVVSALSVEGSAAHRTVLWLLCKHMCGSVGVNMLNTCALVGEIFRAKGETSPQLMLVALSYSQCIQVSCRADVVI
jgi:hypothetical protein